MSGLPTDPVLLPAVAIRAQVPDRYLRILHGWAAAIAEFQASIDNHPVADKALWMRAVLNPDWEDGRCAGLSPTEKGMWATCGSSEPHDAHDQDQATPAAEDVVYAVRVDEAGLVEQLGAITRGGRSVISAFWPEPEGFRGVEDGTPVELAGVVAYWQRHISKQGNTYATGVLRAGDGYGEVPFLVGVSAYAGGGQHLAEGEPCTLVGRVDRRGPLHLLAVHELRGPDVHLVVGPRERTGAQGWVACDQIGREPVSLTQRTRDVAKVTCRACIATVAEAAECER
jgi:hypothetical protein